MIFAASSPPSPATGRDASISPLPTLNRRFYALSMLDKVDRSKVAQNCAYALTARCIRCREGAILPLFARKFYRACP